jgi:hypothetical protein
VVAKPCTFAPNRHIVHVKVRLRANRIIYRVIEQIQLAFLTKAKIRHFGVLSALVKDSRLFKQREKRLLKVVTVNLPGIIQTTTILKSCISWCGDSQTRGRGGTPKWREHRP